RDFHVTGVQTCALPIYNVRLPNWSAGGAGAMSDGTSSEMVLMRGDTVYALSISPDWLSSAPSISRSLAADFNQIFSASPDKMTEIGRASCRARVETPGV